MNKSGTIRVSQNVTFLTESHKLEGLGGALDTSASLVIGDLTKDFLQDLLTMGYSTEYSLSIYNNTRVDMILNYHSINAFTYSTLGIIDYNKDNNYEIFGTGFNQMIINSSLLRES